MIIKPLRQAFQWAVNSVTVADCFACFELVHRAAIGALGVAFAGHIQINFGVRIPNLHVSFGAGAKDTALWVQVFGQEFNSLTHDLFFP
jgi:hypothetical protein